MHEITEEFKNDKKLYDDFKDKLDDLIKELLTYNDNSYHKLETRVKEIEKLDEKVYRKNGKYKKLVDITDIIGIRIITYLEDEVDKIASLIEREFILDKENSIDKRELESDKFGYRSLHYIVSLTDQRQKLTEYQRFKDIKFEIQIRSILQHAWAEIEHDIGYKGEHAIPDTLKRNFYRAAALLETVDIEFVNIKKNANEYKETIEENIKLEPQNIEINLTSLLSFIENDPLVRKIDTEIMSSTNSSKIDIGIHTIRFNIERLLFLEIFTIKDLTNSLEVNKKNIALFAKIWFYKYNTGTESLLSDGVTIFYLCNFLASKNDFNYAYSYSYNYLDNNKENAKTIANELLDIYKQIQK
jgi:ppGpp synthetase/RelA/SpoT-type nucleotidyltranferase